MPALSRLALSLAFGLLAAVACSSAKEEGQVATASELVVRPSAVSLRSGETVQLAVQVNGPGGTPIGGSPLDFVADSTGSVRVSSRGLVSAVGTAGRDSLVVASGTLRLMVPVTVVAGHPAVVDVAGGNRQTGLAGGTLSEPLVVTVRDAFGNPVPRATVRFSAESGGEAAPPTATTDVAGAARVLWTLGPLAGTQFMLVGADSGSGASATVEATARAGAMARVVDIEPLRRRTQAGDSVLVRLRAQDNFGNGVEGAVVAFNVVSGGGDVAPPRIESDSTGLVATWWRTGTTAGTNTLRVRAFQLHDTTFQLTARTIGGAPTALVLVSGDGQRARTLTAVRRSPVVRVLDKYGNPVAAVRVQFVPTAAGSIVQPQELVTDDEGNASPRAWTLGVAGEQQLLVVADGVADTLHVRARATSR